MALLKFLAHFCPVFAAFLFIHVIDGYGAMYDNSNRFPVRVGDRYGYANMLGNVVIEPNYKVAYEFHDGEAFVSKDGLVYEIIDSAGEVIARDINIPIDFEPGIYSDGIAAIPVKNTSIYKLPCAIVDYVDLKGAQKFSATMCRTVNNFVNGYLIATDDNDYNRVYFIDKTGARVNNQSYDGARNFSEGKAAVKVNGKWGFIDEKGNVISDYKYEDVTDFSDGKAGVKLKGKWGYIDTEGKTTIEFKYSMVGLFYRGIAPASLDGEKFGLIDLGGRFVLNPIYDHMFGFFNGMSVVSNNGFYGYINTDGKAVVPLKYAFAEDFRNSLARTVNADGTSNFISKNGAVVFKESAVGTNFTVVDSSNKIMYSTSKIIPDYQKAIKRMKQTNRFNVISGFSDGLAIISININNKPKYGYINTKFKHVLDPVYDKATKFVDGTAYVEFGAFRGCINKRGEFIFLICPKYQVGSSSAYYDVGITEDAINGSQRQAHYYFEINGRLIENKVLIGPQGQMSPLVEVATTETDDLVVSKHDNKYGFVDKERHVIVPFVYENATNFSEGLASVVINKKLHFINKKGEVVINTDIRYDYENYIMPMFVGGVAMISFKDGFQYINRSGNHISDKIFTVASDFSDGFAKVRFKNTYNFLNSSGELVFSVDRNHNKHKNNVNPNSTKKFYSSGKSISSNIVLSSTSLAVTDRSIGLMWARDAYIGRKSMTLSEALRFVGNLNYGGYTDWRLPTPEELSRIIYITSYHLKTKDTKYKLYNIKDGMYWTFYDDGDVTTYSEVEAYNIEYYNPSSNFIFPAFKSTNMYVEKDCYFIPVRDMK
ncbi:WG repeat-containing protein [Geomonas nitrogeniifigens]|uniref:WG repeat-containing protein n=1 Tax=Geomonas diazotrophica TaxID=2843197 RepID=A0ABX8JK14_9BACT|nr:WG repeat-containing protein [Geomonas nitrogeniifigens]QWV98643.1 WG repeat-containing protein [Geomonas nitrogeniifigens]